MIVFIFFYKNQITNRDTLVDDIAFFIHYLVA
jgi:hypothetical protein